MPPHSGRLPGMSVLSAPFYHCAWFVPQGHFQHTLPRSGLLSAQQDCFASGDKLLVWGPAAFLSRAPDPDPHGA